MEDFSKSSSDLTEKKPSFDFNSAVKDLLAGKKLTGEGGILTPLIKELVETALSVKIKIKVSDLFIPILPTAFTMRPGVFVCSSINRYPQK